MAQDETQIDDYEDTGEFGVVPGYNQDKANRMSGIDRIMYILSHKATAAKLEGKDPDKVQASLDKKKKAIEDLYNQHGSSLFDDLKAPEKIHFRDFSNVQSGGSDTDGFDMPYPGKGPRQPMKNNKLLTDPYSDAVLKYRVDPYFPASTANIEEDNKNRRNAALLDLSSTGGPEALGGLDIDISSMSPEDIKNAFPYTMAGKAAGSFGRIGANVATTGLLAGATANKINPLTSLIPSDANFYAAEKVGQFRDSLPEPDSVVETTTGLGVGLTPLGPAMMAAGGPARAAEIIEHGGDLSTAYKAGALDTAKNLASIGGAKALNGFSLPARLAGNAAVAGVAGEAERRIGNEILPEEFKRGFNWTDFGVETTVGSLMGAGKEPAKIAKPKPKPKLRTGDPDIDAGISAGENAAPKVKPEVEDIAPRQTDLFDKTAHIDQPASRDMFSGQTIPADLVESRRQQTALANKKELEQRSPEEQAKLEQDYLLDQQDRLNRGNPKEDVISRRGAIPEQYLGIANAQMPEGDVNTVMHRQMLQALADRGQLRNEPTPVNTPDSQQGQIFEPSKNATAEQTATQGKLELPLQEDLFSKRPSASEPERIAAVKNDPSEIEENDTPKTRQEAIDAIRAKIQARKSTPSEDQVPDLGLNETAPQSLKNQTALTAAHVLEAWANNHDDLLDNDSRDFGRQVQQRAKDLGIDVSNVPILKDVDAWEALKKKNNKPYDKTNALYDPVSKSILINPYKAEVGYDTIRHETVHAVEHSFIQAGMDGKLTGASRQAFDFLSNLVKQYRPELMKAAGDRFNKDQAGSLSDAYNADSNYWRSTYGLKTRVDAFGKEIPDLHEFSAELSARPAFRESLEKLPMDNIQAAKMGMGRLALGKITNMYQALRNGLNRLIGVSPKVDTAYDALAAAHADFWNKAQTEYKGSGGLEYGTGKPLEETVSGKNDDREVIPPQVTNPRSTFQNIKKNITDFGRFLGTDRRVPALEIRTAKENMQGDTGANRFNATDLGRALDIAIKKEGADKDVVNKYMGRDDNSDKDVMSSLDKFPKTKALVDEFRRIKDANVEELFNQFSRNPNPTAAEIAKMDYIVSNPGYTTKSYQPESFTVGIRNTADQAEKILASGGKLNDRQQNAKDIVDNAKDWIKQNILPQGMTGNETLAGLKNRARNLGLDRASIIRDINEKVANGEISKEDAPDAKRAALSDALKEHIPDDAAANAAMDRLLDAVSGITAKGNNPVAKYYRGARIGDLFKERQDVPPELAALWGEIKDPASKVIRTLVKQGNAIAQLKFQGDIRDLGLGRYLFDPANGEPPKGYGEQIKGPSYGALKGLYTSPEVMNALRSQIELNNTSRTLQEAINSPNKIDSTARWMAGKAGDAWTSLVRGGKLIRLGTTPGYYVMYAIGGPSILLNHGISSAVYAPRGLLAHLAEISETFRSIASEQTKQDLQTILKSGFNEGVMHGEMMDRAEALKMKEALESGDQRTVAEAVANFSKKILGRGSQFAQTALSLTDGYAKRAALLHRIDVLDAFYKRQGQNMSFEDIRAEAADWVRDTTATAGRTPGFARMFERYGLDVGLVYGTETVRNTWNSFAHGLADVKRGGQAGDMRMIAHGLDQLVGTGLSVGVMHSAVNGLFGVGLGILGMSQTQISPTDKRQDYLQQDKGPFRGMQPFEMNDPKNPNKDTHFMWAPGDRNDYFYQVSQPLHVLMDAMTRQNAGQKVDWNDESKKAFEAYTMTFWNNAVVRNLLRAAQGRAPSRYNEAPIALEDAQKFYGDMFGVGPTGANRLLSLTDIIKPSIMKDLDVANEAKASPQMKALMASGLGIKAIPSDTGLSDNKGKFVEAALTDARRPLDLVLRSPTDYSPSQIEAAYKQAFKESYKQLNMLKDRFTFGSAYGLSKGAMANAAEDGGVHEEAIDAVMSKNINPAEMLDINIDNAADKEADKAKGDKAKVQAIYDKYDRRQRVLDGLYKKYSKLTPQQIEAL